MDNYCRWVEFQYTNYDDSTKMVKFYSNSVILVISTESIPSVLSIIKSSLFSFLLGYQNCASQETTECIDSGTHFELSSSENMRTRLKFEQNTWNWLLLDKTTWSRLNYLYFYPHKVSSIFLPPLFVFHNKLLFSLKFSQIDLVHQK